MSAGGKAAAGSEVRRRMYFAASRLRGSGCLARFLASLSRRFCSASACSGSLRRITRRRISGSGGGGLAQRHTEAAICKRQPQQRLSVLDFPRPREGPTQPRRCFHVKTRRKARAHFRPVIQNLRANLHPKLESYRDSLCPELNLAPMRVGVRGPSARSTRGESPSPGLLRNPTSPRKRGEVKRTRRQTDSIKSNLL